MSRFVPSLGAPEDLPGPAGLAAFAAVVLAVSVLVLLHQEHAYENDPQLRARAGLVDTTSDISLMRTANFRRALSALVARLPPGGNIRTLSVTPVRVSATLLSSTGAETDVTITPGLHVEVRQLEDRVNDRRGVVPGDIAAAAPARILLGAQRRFGLLPKDFERLELDAPSGASPGGWSATWSQPTDDDGLVAALDGTDLRRPFTPAKGA